MSLTKEITKALIEVHRQHGWRAEKESLFSPRRIDVLAISRGATDVIGFEVKVSINDFRAELRNPSKREAVANHCSQFYFVMPYGMVDPESVPSDCGLIFFDGGYFYVIRRHPLANQETPIEAVIRQEREDKEYFEWYREHATDCVSDYIEVVSNPAWTLPRFVKPLRFQFDVAAVAARMAVVELPPHEVNFDQVPF